jgi:adenosylhomocysteinase
MKYDVKSLSLANEGKEHIEWADRDMPVLQEIRQQFAKKKPLKGLRIAACLHVTAETANLVRTLKAGGAQVVLCASNPLSTQDDTAAALVKHYGISTYAIKGEGRATYYRHMNAALDTRPHITLDDGADLVTLLHTKRKDQALEVKASLEETTTGVIRLRALQKTGKLLFPVFAVNDALTKFLFDNRYGTGQSTVDGIIRATDLLIAGKIAVVAGYGWCGRGLAKRLSGMGAKVIVTEVDPIKALEALMDGFEVMEMSKAASRGDLFVTVTGDIHVIRREHFAKMKDGAYICNSGHFDVEIDIPALKKMARKVERVRPFVDAYTLSNKKTIYILGEGRLINLAAAHGHPASVMDMSFATQALTLEYVAKQKHITRTVHVPPVEIENWIAKLKLKSMGATIDTLTAEQQAYLSGWLHGT